MVGCKWRNIIKFVSMMYVVNLMNAYLDSIYTDEVAFVSGTGQQVDDGTPFATLMDYSPVDIEAAPLP